MSVEDFKIERLEAEVIEIETRRAPSEPEPLRRSLVKSKPYPVHALGVILGEAATAIQRVTKAPLALCGQSILAAASLAAQPHADVTIDGRTYPLTLWAITIAESGERKSAIDGIALWAHKKHERESIERAEQAEPEYQIQLAAYEAALKHAKSKKSRVEIEAAIDDCGERPEPPPKGILVAAEPTIEAIQKIYLSGVSSLGLFSDEGAVFFGGHSMSKDHALRSVGALSKLWDDGTSDRLRASDGQHKLYGKRLAMHMLIQPVVAESVLSDPLLTGQGFLARCLIAWPETTAGTRMYVEANAFQEFAVRRYGARIIELLQRPVAATKGELAPNKLELSAAAKATWIVAYEGIEKQMAPSGMFALVRPWASKAAEQILRIAGVLTVVADTDARVIEVDAITAASELMAWHMGEVLRLVDVARIPPEVKHAEAVLEWCAAKNVWTVDSKTLLNRGPNCVRERSALRSAMDLLVSTGWAEAKSDVVIGGRKVRLAWVVRPKESQLVAESRN